MTRKKTDLSLSVKQGFHNSKFHTHDKTSANSNVFLNTLFLFGMIVLRFLEPLFKIEPQNNSCKQIINCPSVFLGGERQRGFFI
jgi:hypothetical protein